jgi:hypothetical protein
MQDNSSTRSTTSRRQSLKALHNVVAMMLVGFALAVFVAAVAGLTAECGAHQTRVKVTGFKEPVCVDNPTYR